MLNLPNPQALCLEIPCCKLPSPSPQTGHRYLSSKENSLPLSRNSVSTPLFTSLRRSNYNDHLIDAVHSTQREGIRLLMMRKQVRVRNTHVGYY
jgi:hypothetical protein